MTSLKTFPQGSKLLAVLNVAFSFAVGTCWLWIPTGLFFSGVSAIPAMGTGLIILVLMVPLLRGVFWMERQRSEAVYGYGIAVPTRRRSQFEGFKGLLHQQWLDGSSVWFWRGVLHHYLKNGVGAVLVGASAAAAASGLALALMAFNPQGPPPEYRENFYYWLGWLDLPLAVQVVIGASLIGALLVVVAVLVYFAAVRLDPLFDRGLLAPTQASELKAQVSQLNVARKGAVDAAEIERRRIERDLHDGAQPRLVSLAMTLGMAQHKIDTDPDAAKELIREAHGEAKMAITDLRQLARGIHPAVLADRGLDAALSALAARSPIPIDLRVQCERRLPRDVEAVAYFVVAEALTTVAKHSGAERAVVTVNDLGNILRISVFDNGHGGADASEANFQGGLSGLRDRVNAASGTFSVSSPVGGPTLLSAEIPCAS